MIYGLPYNNNHDDDDDDDDDSVSFDWACLTCCSTSCKRFSTSRCFKPGRFSFLLPLRFFRHSACAWSAAMPPGPSRKL